MHITTEVDKRQTMSQGNMASLLGKKTKNVYGT